MEGVAIPAGPAPARWLFRRLPQAQARRLRPRRRQEAARRRRLRQRLQADACTRRTAATPTTSRSPRPWRRCSPASASRPRSEALPPAVFFTRASQGGPNNTPEFSFILVGWATPTGENSGSLVPLANTFDRSKGTGTANRGRYSNPEVDQPVRRGAQDQRRRQARRAAGAGDRDRHRRCRAHSLPLPGQHLGRCARASSTRRARTSTRWRRTVSGRSRCRRRRPAPHAPT